MTVPVAGSDQRILTGRLSLDTHPWLRDHAVFGTVLLPGTGLVELALAAGHTTDCHTLDELSFEAPLLLDGGAVQVQVIVGEPADDGGRPVAVYSRPDPAGPDDEGGEWARHAVGRLAPTTPTPTGDVAGGQAVAPWPPEGAEPLDVETLYDDLAGLGYEYGPAFRGVTAAWRRDDVGDGDGPATEVFAEVGLDADQAEAAAAGGFGIHPALFDAAFHAMIGALADGGEAGRVKLPFAFRGVRVHRPGATTLRVTLGVAEHGDAVSLTAVDGAGEPVLAMDALDVRPVDAAQLRAAGRGGVRDALFTAGWSEVALPSPDGPARSLAVLGGPVDGVGPRYADLAELGAAIDAGAPVPDVVLTAPVAAHAPPQAGGPPSSRPRTRRPG